MKAAVCYELGKPLVIEDVELAGPGREDVKIRLAATAICHSDIHDWQGEMPGAPPFIGGHESAGYVEEVGAGVTSVKVGDPVVVSLLASCGKCYYCLNALPHLCEHRADTPEKPRVINRKGQRLDLKGNIGGFAEYVVVDESQVVKLPEDMPLDRADFVFVTVGSIAAIEQGISFTGQRGTTVLIGLPSFKDRASFVPMDIIFNEKNIIGGFMGATNLKIDIPNLVALYQNGRLKLDELITGRYPLERINEAMALTQKGECLRNVIMFD